MAKRRRRSVSRKGPHCKSVSSGTGKRRKMCFDAKGKITSKAKVDAYYKRTKGRRRAA